MFRINTVSSVSGREGGREGGGLGGIRINSLETNVPLSAAAFVVVF
jgi:hypothetical protein